MKKHLLILAALTLIGCGLLDSDEKSGNKFVYQQQAQLSASFQTEDGDSTLMRYEPALDSAAVAMYLKGFANELRPSGIRYGDSALTCRYRAFVGRDGEFNVYASHLGYRLFDADSIPLQGWQLTNVLKFPKDSTFTHYRITVDCSNPGTLTPPLDSLGYWLK